jgi:hypothetical protein
MDTIAKASDFHRRDILDDRFRELSFQEASVNTRHSTASIKTHKVILPSGRESHRHFDEVGVPEGHARASDWWSMRLDDVQGTDSVGENVRDGFLLRIRLVFHLVEVFKQFVP